MSRARACHVSVVEATYAPATSETDWLQGIVDAVVPIADAGFGVLMNTYEGVSGRLRAGSVAMSKGLVVPAEVFLKSFESIPAEMIDQTWRAHSFGICSELGPLEKMPGTAPMLAAGIRDVLNVNAYDASGIGVTVTVPLPAKRARRPKEADSWERVAAHIKSALRLRQKGTTASLPEGSTAVMSTSGQIEHAADGETADRLRPMLQKAVMRMERARGPLRRSDPESALGLWRPLVDAELTLLDHFEHGGKRYVVAVENPPTLVEGLSTLSLREQQVVAMAASGRSNKYIAYELGLAHSTVRVLLARAARRLHVKSRRELVALHRAHARSEHP